MNPSQSLNLKIKGLFTNFNEFSEAPEGALLEADNIDIVQNSIAEPRRGFDKNTNGFITTTDRADALFEFQEVMIAHHGTFKSAGTLSYSNAGVWTSLGSFSAPSNARMKTVYSNQNMYFTTSAGVKKITAYNSTPVVSGAYKALDITASVNGSGSLVTSGSSVAYRAVWGYKDANNNLVLGAPSQREVYTSGATKDVTLTITIPAGVTVDWFIQIYRSTIVVGSPSDELALVYETNPSSADILAKSIAIVDSVPDSLRGATLYTSASQEGIGAQNEQPPIAKDVAVFRESVFFANTTSKHRFYLTLIAVGGTSGIANDDTVTIGGVAYTGKATETVASAQFKVQSVGSAAQLISDTAKSLVRVINQYASSTVYAYYVSGPDDLPGKILLEERNIGGAAFPVISSRVTCWTPTNIPTSGTATSSSNDVFKNGLAWSKTSQPESVPLPNFVQVGSKDNDILRIIPLREGLYILKDKEGVFKLSGYYPNFTVDKVDSSANLILTESAQVLNNQIYCYTDQGVTVITDSTKVISRPIEEDLTQAIYADLQNSKDVSFGLAYESDRKYYLFIPQNAGDTKAIKAYVFNIFTNAWTTHTLTATCGLVDSDRMLNLGHGDSKYILQQRRAYSNRDYVDYFATTTIDSISSRDLTLGIGVDDVEVGDLVYQSSTIFATITAVDQATGIITVDTNPGFTVAATDFLKAIRATIKWVPLTLANPSIQKQLHTVTILCKKAFSGTATLKFSSELFPSDTSVPIVGRSIGLWGLFPWGTLPWGGVAVPAAIRQWVPRGRQRAAQLSITFVHSVANSPWQITGIALFGDMGSEKVAK